MSEIAIRVETLGKRYRIGQHAPSGNAFVAPYYSLREVLTRSLTAPYRRWRARRSTPAGDDGIPDHSSRQPTHIWALKDVSLEIKRGEVVGIIGRNGAGKSTLLKILSRITKPTEGQAQISGRVGSLLEVGTGFHPELSGRENIYLNGAILGMKKKEIDRKFDEIVAFAEVETFLDTPVKHYSSGMYVRLAFAVAAHLEPEILLVDEVLAVGDAAFQKKCLGKMSDAAREGRTVLLVSHNMPAVQHLCQRCLLFDHGVLVQDGDPLSVITAYNRLSVKADPTAQGLFNHPGRSPGSVPSLINIAVRTDRDPNTSLVRMHDNLQVEATFHAPRPLRDITFGLVVKNQYQVPLFGVNNLFLPSEPLQRPIQRGSVRCRLERLPLMPGIYYLDVYLGTHGHNFDIILDALQFEVHPSDVFETGKIPPPSAGSIFWPASWKISNADQASEPIAR